MKPFSNLNLIVICLFSFSMVAESFGEEPKKIREGYDWPAFLNVNRDGKSKETGINKNWPKEGLPLIWKKEVGIGYSAPSVIGNRLVLHHRIKKTEVVECFEADTGKPIWDFDYPTSYSDPYGYNNGPRCTPLLTKEYCYTFGAEGELYCLDIKTGNKIWHRSTGKDFEMPKAFFGVGATPVLHKDKLIVMVGGQPNSGVVAFDAKTGKTIWQRVGKETWDGAKMDTSDETYEWTGEEMVVTYASPVIAKIHGKTHVLCLMRQGLVSVDPETGVENFKLWFRSTTHESVHAACPVVIEEDLIFVSSCYRTGAVLLKVAKDGKSFTEVWRNKRGPETHWSTAIYDKGYLYGFSGRHENQAIFFCIDAKNGDLKWQTSGFTGDPAELQPASKKTVMNRNTKEEFSWPYYGRGSCIMVDGKFIVLGERCTLCLVDVSPKEFKEHARFTPELIDTPSWAAPVLSRKRLYLRTEQALVCYDLAIKK